MKAIRILAAVSVILAVPACFYDSFAGIKQDPTTGAVTQDLANSPASKVVKTVEAVADVTPVGPIVRLVGEGLLALFGIAGAVRGKQWKTAAIATAQGVQTVVSNLDAVHAPAATVAPSAVADLIKVAVDAAHDDHGVSQGLQNALTPTT